MSSKRREDAGKEHLFAKGSVRCAARALIVEDAKLLTVQMRRPGGDVFNILPGGGQIHGETLERTLQRECMEEIGLVPIIGEIAYVREYIGKHHRFRKAHRNFHQLELVFHCKIPKGECVKMGSNEDQHQVGAEWIALRDLPQAAFYPSILKNYIWGDQIQVSPVYLGDIN